MRRAFVFSGWRDVWGGGGEQEISKEKERGDLMREDGMGWDKIGGWGSVAWRALRWRVLRAGLIEDGKCV